MNEKTFMEGGAQREAEWVILKFIAIPAIGVIAASIGGLYFLILNLSVQTGVIETEIPFLKEEHENIRAELGKGYDKLHGEFSTILTVHYYEGHDESGGG